MSHSLKCPICGFNRTDKRHTPKCSARIKATMPVPERAPKEAPKPFYVKSPYLGKWREI